ncbi:MAG: hypothetical protein AAFP19_26905, partial [Bacteroidota bacterium]
MKYLFSLVLALSLLSSLQATHIIGGSITYEYLGGDDYRIQLEVLRDCFGGNPAAFFDTPAALGVFDQDNNLIDNHSLVFDWMDDTLSLNVPNSVCIFPPQVCVHKAVYDTILSLPPIPGGYTLAYQRCCRAAQVTNLVNPLATGMTFTAHIPSTISNSAPQFNSDFPFAVFVNTPFIYDASAADPDGDSLVYKLNTPFAGGTVDMPMPQPPFPPPYDPVNFVLPTYSTDNMLGGNYPLTIDPQTGQMEAIPSFLGTFQIAYTIEEYRNQEMISQSHREFTFIVISPAASQSYEVTGQVLINDSTRLDKGEVAILERNVLTDSLEVFATQPLQADGSYLFNDILPGVFYIKATPDSSSIY